MDVCTIEWSNEGIFPSCASNGQNLASTKIKVNTVGIFFTVFIPSVFYTTGIGTPSRASRRIDA
jgi:hypothetical protein